MPAAAQLPNDADGPQAPEEPPRRRARRALNDQKRSFLRLASHELRTPLNSILGFSEILATELYGPLGAPQYKEYAEIIQGSGKKLLKLVNQVMEIARLEGANLELDVRAEPLEAIVEETLAGLRDDLAARRLTTQIIGLPETALGLCDPWALRTVLTNLVQNAIAFSPEGGEIRVRLLSQDGRMEILVEDDGEGVDPADLPRLLKPFEQGENALTRRTEGAGLGLPICELTCQAMGGRLQLQASPGQGLIARVQLKGA